MQVAERRTEERAEAILAAACRVIARAGAQRSRLQDIADEADVSKGLIHYYFKTREELLAQAYVFADDRARTRVRAEIERLESAETRLGRLLLLYFADEPELLEDWILWSELSAHAVFAPELRPTMEASYATWISWLQSLVEEAIDEGSLPRQLDANDFAHRLTAIIDGLGSQVVRGLISSARARSLLDASLEREIGGARFAQGDNAPERGPKLATGYLRLLARLTEEAVAELEQLAGSAAEADAVRAVTELVRRVAGGASAATSRSSGAPSPSSRRP